MPSVLVAGGGLAGIAAATALAERGVEVHVIERESFLGGRVGAWTETLPDGASFEMERGLHAFFRHYKNVRSLIRRIDPALSCLRPLDDYPLFGPGGHMESFARLPKRTPFNVLALIRRSPSIRLVDLLRIDVARAREMLAFDSEATYRRFDESTAAEFLDALGFPRRARELLFGVFAHSFFNPEEKYSAAELLAMFHFYFTQNPEGLVFDVLREPFSVALWNPLEQYLRRLGVEFSKGTSVGSIERGENGELRIRCAGHGLRTERRASAVVLATEVPALRAIVKASPMLQPLAIETDGLDVTLPFAVLRVWLDQPCLPSRPPFAGTAGIGILDSITIYDRIEGESARWARAHGGSIVELHGYAVDPARDEPSLRAELLANLHTLYPETKNARILHERFLLRRDCPSFAPGSHSSRPGVETPVPGVVLAGDYVKLPFPSALMERAVSSGFLAANVLLRSFGLPVHAVAESPRRGLLRQERVTA